MYVSSKIQIDTPGSERSEGNERSEVIHKDRIINLDTYTYIY